MQGQSDTPNDSRGVHDLSVVPYAGLTFIDRRWPTLTSRYLCAPNPRSEKAATRVAAFPGDRRGDGPVSGRAGRTG